MEAREMNFVEDERTVSGPNGTVHLTARECALLACLIEHVGEAVTRNELLAQAWGWHNACDVKTKTVDVHIGRLRGKLKSAGLDPRVVQTVRCEGYRLRSTREDV